MGPMKDGRGVLWSCLLRTSISEDAKESSSLLQSRSMDMTEKRELPYLESREKVQMIYIVQMKKIYYDLPVCLRRLFSNNTRDLSRGSYEMMGVSD